MNGCANLVAEVPAWRTLLDRDEAERMERGYDTTLHEILQQPETWRDTARRMADAGPALAELLLPLRDGGGQVVLTGSGSSLYAGECVALPLQATLGVPVQALATGLLLTHAPACLAPGRPFLLVSLARSGMSPESAAAVELLLETRPDGRHLVITCNGAGRLATRYAAEPRVRVVVLDERTNDKSLVMTSSFTNVVVAAGMLGRLADRAALGPRAEAVATLGCEIVVRHGASLARRAEDGFGSAVYLGTASGVGAAREAALKMLEMTAGRVGVLAESFLGLRHGPMSAVHSDTLVIAFLSAERRARAYELDVLRELERKGLGAGRVLVGDDLPSDVMASGDVAVDPAGLSRLAEDEATVIQVLVGQILAFFRCLALGLKPDAPSPTGVIRRVVEEFAIHR